jgi:hypothetical protein
MSRTVNVYKILGTRRTYGVIESISQSITQDHAVSA